MGAAALHYLVELGCERPVLVERETLASGSTGRCAGGVRTLFSDDLNRRICDESIRRLERFEDEVGQELDLRLWGYLFLLETDADAARFARRRRRGCSRRTARASWCRSSTSTALSRRRSTSGPGYVTPDLVVQGYARRAAQRGALVEQSCAADAHPRRRHARRGGRDVAWDDRDRARDPHRRRLVERAFDLPRRARAALHVLHRGRPVVPARAAADDRLRDRLLLPPRRRCARARRPRADARGARSDRRAAVAVARRARDPLELVGLVRDEPRPQRARRRRRRAGGPLLRDGVLRPRLPARPGRRRAPGAARARRRADVRPLAVLRRALRERCRSGVSRT